MKEFTIKDYIIITIIFILTMGFLALYYVGGPEIRHDLKLIAFSVIAGAVFMFIALCGKDERR